jgi:hypothetical protein
MAGAKKRRQRLLDSTDNQCAFCAPDGRSAIEPNLELAHIQSNSREGSGTYWNLLPLCGSCNPPSRETIGWRIDENKVLKAYDYWTFWQSRLDVAIKVATYSLFETACSKTRREKTVPHLTQLLDCVIWTCRSVPFANVEARSTELKRRLDKVPGAASTIGYITPEDQAIKLFDSDDHLRGFERLASIKNLEENRIAAALPWRIYRIPTPKRPVSHERILQAATEGAEYLDKGARDHYGDAKVFDRRLREAASQLSAATAIEDKSIARTQAKRSIDLLTALWENTATRPLFRTGRGVAKTYQLLAFSIMNATARPELQFKFGQLEDIFEVARFFGWQGESGELVESLVRFPKHSADLENFISQSTDKEIWSGDLELSALLDHIAGQSLIQGIVSPISTQ